MMPLVHRRHNNNNNNNNKTVEEEVPSTTTHLPTSSSSSSKTRSSVFPTITRITKYDTNTTTKATRFQIKLVLLVLQILIIVVALYRTKPKIQSTTQFLSIIVATWFVSFPILLIVASGLGIDSNEFTTLSSTLQKLVSSHEQYIPLSIVATIIGNQLPSYLTSGCVAIGLTVFGLISRPTTTTTTTTKQVHSIASTTSSNKQQQSTKKKNRKRNSNTNSKSNTKQHFRIGPMHAVLATFGMTFVMLVENFLVWVVSATYKDSQQLNSLPKPLQDNGKIVMRYFVLQVLQYQHVVKLRNMINVQWLLVTGLGLSLGTVVLYGTGNNSNKNTTTKKNLGGGKIATNKIRRSLWSLAVRGLLTMSVARFLRTISFSITVLPSQNTKCYFHRFPYPPPQEWKDWLLVGFIPQINGGCNDLIISGHATVTSTMACIITSTVNKHTTFTVALWMLVIFDYMIEVYEGFHYSVDMFLGGVIVNFIWNTLSFLETNDTTNNTMQDEHDDDDDDDDNQEMDNSIGSDNAIESGGGDNVDSNNDDDGLTQPQQSFYSMNQEVTKMEVLRYAIPPLGAYLQVTKIIPSGVGNYTIVAYILYAMMRVYKIGFDQYSQHVLFCLLYLALGVYL